MPLEGFELLEQLHASHRNTVARGRDASGRPVIIKFPTAGGEAGGERPRYENERRVYEQIESARVPQLRALVHGASSSALVFEDAGCHSLDKLFRARRPSVLEALEISLCVLEALTALHECGLVHRDVKPGNIIADPDISRVLLIDFGIAAPSHRALRERGRLEGTVAYMAPELTGRVNRRVDYRSDYYCLGATLYWLLCGQAPFGEGEVSELVHAHIARQPVAVDVRVPGVPRAVARIVAKLLAKSAAERYQGAYGLRLDLERCVAELGASGEVSDFELASVDPSEQLRLPQELIGRARERSALDAALDAVQAGEGPGVVWLGGALGSGKSSLLLDFQRRHEDRVECLRHEFASEAAAPLATLAGMLRPLLHQAHADPERRARVTRRLEQDLGASGALLFDHIPELGQVLGAREPLPEVDPVAAQTRLWDTVARYIDAVLLPERSYVFMFDGVVDEAGLRLIEGVVVPGRRALVILASQSGPPEPLRRHAREVGARELELELGPLEADSVHAWLAGLLEPSEEREAFIDLLYERSHGMPSFLEQILLALHGDEGGGLLRLDRETGRWRANLGGARARQSSGDVVEFLVARLDELPDYVRSCLGVAAHLGPSFRAETLSSAQGEGDELIERVLIDAVAAGLVIPLPEGGYRFVHDDVRAAAEQSSSQAGAVLHAAIARRLAGAIEDDTLEGSSLFAIATHVERGLHCLEGPERERFAALCERAASQALRAVDFDLAARHYGSVVALLPKNAPGRFTALLQLGLGLGLTQRPEAALTRFAQATAMARTATERVQVLEVRIRSAMASRDVERALEVLLEAGALYDLDLRRGGSQEWVGGLLGRTLEAVAARDTQSIVAGPLLVRYDLRVLYSLLRQGTTAAYLSGDFNLAAALFAILVELSLEHGYSDASGTAFVQLGLASAAGMGDFEGAQNYASIGFALLERFPEGSELGFATLVYGMTIQPWAAPMTNSIAALERGHERLHAGGMFDEASHCLNGATFQSMLIGDLLPTMVERVERLQAYVRRTGTVSGMRAAETLLGAIQRLSFPERAGERGDEGREALPADPVQRREFLEPLTATDAFFSHSFAAFAHWALREDELLARCIEAALPLRTAGAATVFEGMCDLWLPAVLAARYAGADAETRARDGARVEVCIARLRRWERSCAHYAGPLRALAQGYWARALGDHEQALRRFDEAADGAAEGGYVNLEAMANEDAGEALVALGRRKSAVGYFDQARRCYARWGALACLRRLEARLREGQGPLTTDAGSGSASNVSSTSQGRALDVDILSVIEMSQAMSEAARVEDIISYLLRGSVENAGADRGLLLREDEAGVLRVVGLESSALEPGTLGASLEEAEGLLALSIVRAALDTGSPVVVDDAALDQRCARDRRVVQRALRSILALPIPEQSGRTALLYLENRMLDGVFSALELEILATLARQATVALDNARLFEAVSEREARWRSLVDNAPDFILVCDRERTVQFINRASYGEGLGDREAFIGIPVDKLVQPGDRERVREAVEAVFRDGGHASFDAVLATPGGPRHMTTRLGPIKRGDLIDGVTLISSDQTERRQLEAQLRQAQKMQAIGTLAGGVAHDFNNLLTVIHGSAELAMLDASEDSPVHESLEAIIDASERASRLTQRLLAFSRKSVLKPERIDVNAQVQSLAGLLQRLLGETVDLQLDLERDEAPCCVDIDPGQLEQVLLNLAVNARDAMPDGGRLELSTAVVEGGGGAKHGLEGGSYVQLVVQDEGPGIPPEVRERMFEPFFTTKEPGKGTGLGLSTVLGIVEQSGGQLFVDSEAGEGARFSVYIPRVESPSGGGEPSPEREPALLSAATILVVEDEDAVRQLAALLLERRGYRVLQAKGGDEADRIAAREGPIDMVLADVVMPVRNGLVVVEGLLARRSDLGVLFMSGYTDDAIMRHGVLDGTHALLQKPFTSESLVAAVEGVLRGRQRG